MRVLAVDDDSASLRLTEYLLRAFGHEMVARSCAHDGLAEALRGAYDIVLIDICLPGFDGYEFVRHCKAAAALRFTPLIPVTAQAMVGDRDKALAAGFDEYITKPIEPSEFVAALEALCVPS